MKKWLSLVLVLCLLLPCAALASATSVDLSLDKGTVALEEGALPYIESTFAYGGKLYMTSPNSEMALYVWSPETGAVTQLPIEGVTSAAVLADGEKLYLFDNWQGTLSTATLTEDGLKAGEALPLDAGAFMRQDGEYSYGGQVYSIVTVDGQVYLLADAENDEDYDSRRLFRLDLATGKMELLFSGKGILSMSGYKDGSLLCMIFDRDSYYSSEQSPSALPKVQVFDLKTRALGATVVSLASTSGAGLAYDADSDIIYLCTGEGLYRKAGQGELELVNYLPLSYYGDNMRGILIGAGHYALTDWSGIYIRSTNPADKPSTVLRVSGVSFGWDGREGYDAFMKKHPEVAVNSNTDKWFNTPEAMYQDFMTDTAADIYSVSDISMLQTLIRKGYAKDLGSSQVLSDAVKGMYPHMTSSFYQDGKLYAFPFMVYGSGQWAYSPYVLSELGLTEADLPKTISELIDFIVDWVDIYSFEHQQLDLFWQQYQKTRDLLLGMIFQQQIAWCEKTGTPLTFDTPEVTALLQKLDEVSSIISDLDPSEEEMNAGWSWSSDDKMKALFTADFYLFDNYMGSNYDYTPLPVGLSEAIPTMYPLQMQLLFVNPNTKHFDLAASLLEEIALHMRPRDRIQVFPDANEPVENTYYEKDKQYYDEYVQGLQKSIEDAKDEAEKKQLEQSLADSQEWAKSIEANRYEISDNMIAQYRAMAENVLPAANMYTAFFSSEELSSLFQRLSAQQMTGEQFIRETEKILRKMRLESK